MFFYRLDETGDADAAAVAREEGEGEEGFEFGFDAIFAEEFEEFFGVAAFADCVEGITHLFWVGAAFGAADGFHAVHDDVDFAGVAFAVALHVPEWGGFFWEEFEEGSAAEVFADFLLFFATNIVYAVFLHGFAIGEVLVAVARAVAEVFEEFAFEFAEIFDRAFGFELEHGEDDSVAPWNRVWFLAVACADTEDAGDFWAGEEFVFEPHLSGLWERPGLSGVLVGGDCGWIFASG